MKPDKIGRYEVEEEIGRGGMATVFKAYDPRFERHVAIKVLPPEFMHDTEFRARFNREAKTIAALEHPAIVPVYDYGEDAGLLYLVMRYMPGGSLADRLEEGPLSIEESAEILQRLGSALDRAHSEGIIHRDLKPSNILFDQYGDAFLADFGIVRLTTSDSNLTASGSLMGTPTYMSPEQVYGDKELDGRSDIYALGVILFQMLTGHLPYEADTPAKMMMKHILEPVPQILSNRPDLPPEAEEVVSRALAKERDQRFASAADLNAALSTLTQKSKTSGEVQEQLATMQAAIMPELASQQAVPGTSTAESVSAADEPPADLAEAAAADVLSEMATTPARPQATPTDIPVHTAGAQRTLPVWLWVIGLLFLICLCLSGIAGVLISNGDEILASVGLGGTAVAQNTATAVAFTILDVDEAAAATAKAELLATRNGLATSAAIAASDTAAAPTAVSTDTPSPAPTTTAALSSEALAATRESLAATRGAASAATPANDPAATRQSLEATRQALAQAEASAAAAVFGPLSGSLPHEDDDTIESVYADVSLGNFVAQATVLNPYAAAEGGWDFGLIFRQTAVDEELRLVIRSDGSWNLNNRSGDTDSFVQDGEMGSYLDGEENGRNTILLIANEGSGYFFLNGQFVDVLDLSERTDFGDLALGTGFYSSDEQDGAVTNYESFGVWPYVPAFGPNTGELVHALDGFVKMEPATVELQSFVAEVEFRNPYDADTGGWDWGFAFRETDNEYWLVVASDDSWSLVDRRPDDDYFVDEGVVENLAKGEGEANTLTLIAAGATGALLLNDSFIAELDLQDRLDAGDVAVVAAFFEGNEVADTVTRYDNFTIWPLP